jgi:dihydrofolate reductase
MDIVLIAAASDPGLVIGVDGHLPWKQLTDLDRFRAMTKGRTVIMGRKTYDSLPPNRRPLPNRVNIILTRQEIDLPGSIVTHTIEAALEEARKTDTEYICVIGGGDIYRLAMPYADVIELTLVHAETEGTATFPEIDLHAWKEVSRETHPADERNEYAYTFVRYERM